MDDGGKQPHSFGSGQQRTHHPRPFFYVQPPSQPYYLYQHWHLNNPYNQYGLLGGYNLGRPCMHPYPYMQYPGYVFPPAPMHPMEYRRMFEPRFHSPPWNDTFRQQQQQQHHHPQQAPGRREMACSEAQTDPSDAITKLIECLDKIRANELGGERELDSGVASQASGVFSLGDEKKSEEQGAVHASSSSAPESSRLPSPAVTFSDSTTAVYDGESSQRSLEDLSAQGCWSVAFDEELPLDSSSVHEECPDAQQPAAAGEQFLPHRPPEKFCLSENPKAEVTDIQSDVTATNPDVPRCNAEELLKQRGDALMPSTQPLPPRFSSNKDAKNGDKLSKTQYQTESPDEVNAGPSFQILKLPFESALTAGALLKESGVLYGEQPTALASGRLSSPTNPYYYNYLSAQTSHERMSVLSPSLDELSSRDEMFSTDLEDMDLFPKRVYTSRRLAEAAGASPQAAEGAGGVWPAGSKRFTCACCGKSVAKGASRSKVHSSSKLYGDEAGDSDEESRYGRSCEQPARVVARKHSAPRKPHPLSLRQVSKPWHKRGQCRDPSHTADQEEGQEAGKEEPADGETRETGSDLQCRTCEDRLCREDLATSDQGRWEEGDVKPRRRQPTPLQRQEINTLRKAPCKPLMYHRPRDEKNNNDDDDEEEPQFHWERDMEAAASTSQHMYGPGPRGPNLPPGAQQAPGPHQPAQGPYGAPRPEEQHQHHPPQQHQKPFFYIQPSQPYMPMQNLQWPMPLPMPVSYNPYCGFPGLGYGMPVMPHYQPSPYMEPPGYVLPHTHLHLMDYRRMLNPHHYQTMAYHARRFRYQHNAPTREMISSEVQTEPLSARPSPRVSSEVEAFSGFPVCSNNDPDKTISVPTSQPLSPAMAVQTGDRSVDHKDAGPSPATRPPPKSSFVIQTEEVRIECCSTPVGLQVLRSHETAELSHGYSQDVARCSSVLEGRALQEEGLCLPADQSEQCLQTCPDILLVGTPSDDQIPALEESRNQMEPESVASDVGSRVMVHSDAHGTRCEEDLNMSRASNSADFKVLHMPFDLEELRGMESTVWSMEETCIPTSEWLIQNGLMEPHMETLTPVAEDSLADALIVREEVPVEEAVPVIEMPPLVEDPVVEVVPTAEGPVVEMASEAAICPTMDVPVTEEVPVSELSPTAEVTLTSSSLLVDNSPLTADLSPQRGDLIDQDHQETSFESLPAYLPSTSWLADFENTYYSSKMPPTPQKQTKSLSSRGTEVSIRRRKLDLEYKEHPTVLKPKDPKTKQKVDRQSLSDHECCLNRNFNENAFTPCGANGERLCARCLSKRRIRISASPGLDSCRWILKRKAVPFQPWNDALLPTCEACKSHTNKRLPRKGPSSDGPYHEDDTEGETSENSSCRTGPKWRGLEDPRKPVDPKRPLAPKQHLPKCPVALYPKLRENNCACSELQHQPVAWERLRQRPHRNATREMNEENCGMSVPLQDKWRNMDQRYLAHKWQTEKPWKPAVSNPDGSKNGARSQHLNKHKKSQPQSQGTHRKDTRC